MCDRKLGLLQNQGSALNESVRSAGVAAESIGCGVCVCCVCVSWCCDVDFDTVLSRVGVSNGRARL
jgi:hypothetical protein